MSKERANNRTAREHEAALKAAAKGHEQDRQERLLSMKGTSEVLGKHGGPAITQPTHHKPPKPRNPGKTTPKASSPGKTGSAPKQPAARTPSAKKRNNGRTGRPGRPDGPLARRRRMRIRLLVGVLVLLNVVVAVAWRDWAVSVAVLIGSVILAPLLAAMLLRRKR